MASKLPVLFLLLAILPLFHCFSVRSVLVNESFIENPKHLTNEECTNLFKNLVEKYPNRAKLHTIGKSVQNRDIIAIEISSNVNNRTLLKPMFKYVANMHGDETVGRQLMIYLAEYLLLNYGTDDRVTKLVDSVDIYLMPSLNPDGFAASKVYIYIIFPEKIFKYIFFNLKEGLCDSLPGLVGRENANHIDLNRDFPDQFDTKFRAGNILSGRQPETIALMTWVVSNPFVLSGNLHGGAVVASYPFDDSSYVFCFVDYYFLIKNKFSARRSCCVESLAPDNAVFKQLALTYADAHTIMRQGGNCEPEHFPKGITNGAFWYEVVGGMQDFNYVHSNCFEVTFELSCCKFPSASTMPEEWHKNKESLLSFIEAVHWGVKGLVKDEKDLPIHHAAIVIEGINYNVTTSERGEYWRLLVPGNYSLQVFAEGLLFIY